MAASAKFSIIDRMKAIFLHGYSMRKIAEEPKRSIVHVNRLVSRLEETNSIQDSYRSGSPLVSNPCDDRVLTRIEKNRKSSHEIAKL